MDNRSKQSWSDLRLSGHGDGKLEIPSKSTGVETGFGAARFALGPDGEPRLLVPCHLSGVKRDFGSTPKLRVVVTRYNVSGHDQHFIDLISNDRALDTVFAELTEEILSRLRDGAPPEKAVAGTIDDFRLLLMAETSATVDGSLIVGLVGELYVLSLLALHDPDCASTWTGPWDLRHDFRGHETAIEVKSSTRSDARVVSINGIDQLEPPTGGKLVLIHLRLEPIADGHLSLATLFSDLVELGVNSKRLREGLAETGCLDPEDPNWNRLKFALQGASAWRVELGFPRLTASEMVSGSAPAGVSGLKYQVDLSAAEEFLITENELENFLKGLIQ